MTTFDIDLRIAYDMEILSHSWPMTRRDVADTIKVCWRPSGRYNATVFFTYRDGRSYAVNNFTAIHDGEWHQVNFLNNGRIWIIDYRTQVPVPSAHEENSPGSAPTAG